MSTPAQKARKTRAKNKKAAQAEAVKLSRANARARSAVNKLKAYKEGFKDGLGAK